MAVIARKLLLAAMMSAATVAADQAHDVLRTINHVASALTGGNPADAMISFDKSCPNYTSLQDDFIGLTDGYELSNEADVTDEADSPTETTLTLQWTLSLTNKSSSENLTRKAEIHVRLRKENGKWKIVDFSPADFFNLAAKQ
jgi:hypothetical protein